VASWISVVSVVIAGDDPLARAGLAAMIGGELAVLAERSASESTGPEASAIVLDLGADPRVTLDRARWISAGPPVVAIVGAESFAREALQRGVRGILLRGSRRERLVSAVIAVSEGLVVIDPEIAAHLFEGRGSIDRIDEALTAREIEVLELVAQGLSNKQIADRLGISDHTVKFHLNAIVGKLGAQGRTDAVVRAAKLGMILI
jgi:two-component system, NarL family, nitrate/nitrite response regulator NarL